MAVLLSVTCAALCQQADTHRATNTLPDAPSALAFGDLAKANQSTVNQSRVNQSSTIDPAAMKFVRQLSFGRIYNLDAPTPTQKNSTDFFGRYFSPSSVRPAYGCLASNSDSLIGRATYAASSILYMRDDAGQKALNTPYLLRVLAAAVAHSAYRPYWKRSISQPFSDFGATVGNDAGMKVFHEFEPGILQLVKSHEPRFVSKIEQHFNH